jgi:signal transduction histidine kinase
MTTTDAVQAGVRAIPTLGPISAPGRRQVAHAAPFAVVALAGQLSSLLDLTDIVYFWLALLALFATAAVLFAPRRPYSICVAAALYVASVAALVTSNGGMATSGLGVLFFLVVVGVALYGEPRDSVVAVALVVGFLLLVTLASPHTAPLITRRVVFLGTVAAVISLAIHALRARLEASNRRTSQLLHQSEAMNTAAHQLAVLRQPASIASTGSQLAAQLASRPGAPPAEACYIEVRDGYLEVVARAGRTGTQIGAEAVRPADATIIMEVARTRRPMSQRLRGIPGQAVYAAWVPVCHGDAIHGVLKVVSATSEDADSCADQLNALALLMEMALANWSAHEELERQATSEDRRRLARDLHDGLAHELAFIATKARRSGAPPEFKEISGAADRALDEARRAITVLSATAPQSLVAALAQTAEDLGSRLGVPVLVDLDERVEVQPEIAEQLLRIVREALTNAAVHGAPQYVTLTLRDEGMRYELVIADDGCGFDPRHTDPTRFGLASMRERTASFGGLFSVESAPGRGTRVAVTFR